MPTITKTLSSTQRQGSYGGNRYHGKYNFGVTGFNAATMNVDSATLALVATASGKSDSRQLYLRQGTSQTGKLIKNSNGGYPWVNRDTTNTIYLSTTQQASLKALEDGSFGMYVDGSTDNYYFTDSTGNKYSSCYIKISKAVLTINWSYKNGTLNLSKTNINIGEGGDSSITATISNYVSTYYYKIKVTIGDSAQEYELGNESSKTLDFTEDIYKNWINDSNFYLFKNSKTLSGTVTLTTYSDSNYLNKLGNDSIVLVNFSATGLIPPAITAEKITYSNNSPYQGITNFAIPGQGSIYAAFSETTSQGATIVKRTITTNFSSSNSFSSSSPIAICKLDSNISDGNTYSITITITDSRGDSAKITFSSLIIQRYTPPKVLITPSRIINEEKQQLRIDYSITLFQGATIESIKMICKEGSDNEIININTDTNTDLKKELISFYISKLENGISELEHFITMIVKDSYGGENDENSGTVTLPSESFYLHFGASEVTDATTNTTKEIISLGIGGAAPSEENTVRCYWDAKFDKSIEWDIFGGKIASQEAFKKMIGNLMYPIGSIYMSTSSTNPSSLFGGAWIAWGSGRVPVGINSSDSNFNTVEKTGGSVDSILVEHKHAPSTREDVTSENATDTTAKRYFTTNLWTGTASVARRKVSTYIHTTSGSTGFAYAMTANLDNSELSASDIYEAEYTTTEGETGTNKNLQPYITCYMWKRTA